ncbi:MAG: alkaline phosphatase D family protein [Bacteroidales bacterium]|nr:alkaline phosphatase D family protein [Bacteroidales bacterium]
MKLFIAILIILPLCMLSQNHREYKFKNRLSFSLDPAYAPFYHGVASGDPLDTAVIIWTRVTPSGQVDSILVEWQMALDTNFTQIVKFGQKWTRANRDFTVKIDVGGLSPNTWYFYRFKAFNLYSIIGRTKTLPAESSSFDNFRIAFIGGTNYNNGYYNALNTLTMKNNIDLIIHNGDYIYEYETNHYGTHPDRELSPNWECITLEDYRMRYAHYRLDPDMRLAHQQYPWIVTYDDHETANNSWKDGAENHQTNEGNWIDRKHAGQQAFYEWIPIREINDPQNPDNKIHRLFKIGKLARLFCLDTRLEGRDDPNGLGIDDPNKTILGTKQYNWLTNELYKSQYTDTCTWKILVNQVMISPLLIAGQVVNKDQWDGYRYERQRLLNYLYGWNIKNTVVTTGDIHTSWACDVPNQTIGQYGPNGQGVGTVEFVSPSITSPSISFGGGIGASAIYASNAHIRWVDLEHRGYYILDIRPNKVQADWFFVDDINNYGGTNEYNAQSWYVLLNENFIRQSSVFALPIHSNPPFAPFLPIQTSVAHLTHNYSNDLVLLSLAPNPFKQIINLQLYSKNIEDAQLELIDINGKVVFNKKVILGLHDLEYLQLMIPENLAPGTYNLFINTNKNIISRTLIKYE